MIIQDKSEGAVEEEEGKTDPGGVKTEGEVENGEDAQQGKTTMVSANLKAKDR